MLLLLQVIVADSFGGSDEPVDTLVAGLLGVDAQVLGDALRVKEEPTHMLYQAFEEAGTDLAQVGCFVCALAALHCRYFLLYHAACMLYPAFQRVEADLAHLACCTLLLLSHRR
jgi:hypothetical protein